jgi:ABC-type cobalamin/Fe3+-siderophores transport system ATPase subunit
MSYVRLTKTVKDKGKLVKPSELDKLIDDRTIDWYYSPFTYGEDALEYFSEHNRSIKGYAGDVSTSTLYWDLDCEGNFEKVRENAIKLVDYLVDGGFGDGLEVFFSGGKGVHVLLHTKNKFNPAQTGKICHNVAIQAGVDKDVFDTTVYNINRIFRCPYTKHQKSGLYKVHLDIEDLISMPEEEIKEIAANAEELDWEYEEVDASSLLDKYGKTELKVEVESVSNDTSKLSTSNDIKSPYGDFNPYDCPPDKRRCIFILENGYFGPGERENATIRLAAAYRGMHKDREEAKQLIIDALNKREEVYGPQNKWTEEDIERNLDQVYSDAWNGGTYSCKSDDFLRSKCDLGGGPCCLEHNDDEKLNVVGIGGLINQYIEYGKEALKEYPKTGLQWIDDNIRIRPRNFSIINGANGSGKTSLVIQILENMNKQNVPVIFFSLDMANTSLFEKLGARYTKYTQRQVEAAFNINSRNEQIMNEVAEAVRVALPLTVFDFTSSVDSNHIEKTIRVLKTREQNPINIQVAFVDYAGRVTGDKDNEFSNATQVALEANDIAKRTNTHVMYLSQIPREDGDHTDAILSSRVSKHSGAWEENATFIMNCWRPFGDGLKKNDRFFHIYIAKNRSGPLGEHVFNWEGKTGSIWEMDRQEFDEYYRLCEEEDKREPPAQFEQDDSPMMPSPDERRKALSSFAKARNASKEREETDEEYAARTSGVEAYIDQQERNDALADAFLKEADERDDQVQHSKAAQRPRFGAKKAQRE